MALVSLEKIFVAILLIDGKKSVDSFIAVAICAEYAE
jgi:hypothetical protein